jgi:hypothetical protein
VRLDPGAEPGIRIWHASDLPVKLHGFTAVVLPLKIEVGMAIDFVGWQEVYIAPVKYKNRHNQEKCLPTGAGEEDVADEE